MQLFAVKFIPLPGSLYMFREFYTAIIMSTILTVSTASGTNHCIVSATFFQRGLLLVKIGKYPLTRTSDLESLRTAVRRYQAWYQAMLEEGS